MEVARSAEPSKLRALESEARCPRCGRRLFVTDGQDGELVCSACGFVLKDRVEDEGQGWRAGNGELGNGGVGTGPPTSITIHDMGLATKIGSSNFDASGKSISGPMRAVVSRLRTWDSRSQAHESVDRNLRKAFDELDRSASKLSVSEAVLEKAAYIYRKSLRRNLIRGRSTSVIAGACLYAACRESEVPRTLKDVSAVTNIERRELARSYRLLLKEMDISMPISDPSRCVAIIASRTHLQEKVRRRALELLKRTKELELSSVKEPMGLAATVLYVACTLEGHDTTQRELADAAGVTEVTLRNRYRDLKLGLDV